MREGETEDKTAREGKNGEREEVGSVSKKLGSSPNCRNPRILSVAIAEGQKLGNVIT